MLPEPAEVGLAVGGIDDQQIPELFESVDDQVVDDPAVLVRQERVLRLARTDLVEVVRECRLQERRGARPFDLELTHVRNVEDAAVSADRTVLGDDSFVEDRHLPAGERHHARPECDVPVVERGLQQHLGHRPTMLTSAGKVPLQLCL